LNAQPPADPDATFVPRGPAEPDADATLTPDAFARIAEAADSADATVFIPTPGRRRPADAPAVRLEPVAADLESLVGLNPLVAAANRLLSAVPQIRSTLRHPDPAALRAELLNGITKFQELAQAKGYGPEQIRLARHALCALLDESVQNTPWASQAAKGPSLLQEVEASASGKDNFFLLLNDLENLPAANLEVLEFFAACLALGFEGELRNRAGGRAQLQQIRTQLIELVRRERGAHGLELSVRWRGLDVPLARRSPWLFTWVSACVCAAILVGVYLGLRVLLAIQAEPLARTVASLKAKDGLLSAHAGQPVTPRLKSYLAKELAAGQLALVEDGVKSVVTISGDNLFASGRATIDAAYLQTVLRIAQALNKVPGSIIITGHSDDRPIRTARFPSNWELSRERAHSVVKLMAGEIADPSRLRAEGLADSEPIAPNDSPENRAKNRRVTAILRVASQ